MKIQDLPADWAYYSTSSRVPKRVKERRAKQVLVSDPRKPALPPHILERHRALRYPADPPKHQKLSKRHLRRRGTS